MTKECPKCKGECKPLGKAVGSFWFICLLCGWQFPVIDLEIKPIVVEEKNE